MPDENKENSGSKNEETEKSKKDKTETNEEVKEVSEPTDIPVMPALSNVKTGSDAFSFPNGDVYLGEYEATIDHTIFRQGKL